MKYTIGLDRHEIREVKVEPFLIDLRREELHCPWCKQSLPLQVMNVTMFDLLGRTSRHIGEHHPDKHTETPIGFLIAEPIT